MSSKPPNVLVVDDEEAIRDMIRFALEKAGMAVQLASGAQEALERISEKRPDIILLDWMMPGISGLELTRRLRRDAYTEDIPIIMLTARVTEDDKVAGLEAGTDDYVVKPFSPRELLARIRAVTRRSSAVDEGGRLNEGNLTLDTISRRVLGGDGEELHMGPTEYRLLEFFMSHPGRAYSRSQILDHVWEYDFDGNANVVETYVSYLWTKLAAAESGRIHTVRGVGIRLEAPGDR